jgi:DNA-directed RNA polymerase specialized sigma subunit
MSGRRKLSQAGVEWVVDVVTRRRELERRLSMFPTNAVIAEELGVSERWIAELVRKRARVKVSRETENSADTSLRVNNLE